jgi:hypothetical protein
MLGGADKSNGDLGSYITGADNCPFFNTSPGADRDTGCCRCGLLGKTFIALSHVKTDLS